MGMFSRSLKYMFAQLYNVYIYVCIYCMYCMYDSMYDTCMYLVNILIFKYIFCFMNNTGGLKMLHVTFLTFKYFKLIGFLGFKKASKGYRSKENVLRFCFI